MNQSGGKGVLFLLFFFYKKETIYSTNKPQSEKWQSKLKACLSPVPECTM